MENATVSSRLLHLLVLQQTVTIYQDFPNRLKWSFVFFLDTSQSVETLCNFVNTDLDAGNLLNYPSLEYFISPISIFRM